MSAGATGRTIDNGRPSSDGAIIGLFPPHVLRRSLDLQEEKSQLRQDCCAGFYWR